MNKVGKDAERAIKRKLNENTNLRVITPEMIGFILAILVGNVVVYGFIWQVWLKDCLGERARGGFFWYFYIPLLIEIILFVLLFAWNSLGKKLVNTSFPDSFINVFIISFLYVTEIGVMVYFFRSFSFAPLYFGFVFLSITMFKSIRWGICILTCVCIEASLIVSNVFEFDAYRIDEMPLGADIFFAVHTVILVSGLSIFVYCLRRYDDNRVAEIKAKEIVKSELLASMSHELRTPINAILGMNEMISRVSDSEEITNYSDNITSSGKALLALINDVLDYSKIESGKMQVRENEYSLADLIHDTYNVCIQPAEKKGIAFVLDVESDLPLKLCGDEGRIRQILINLCTNAVKYTEKGRVIFGVKALSQNNQKIKLEFTVEDTGVGISKENREKLFEPFVRIDIKRNSGIEGTGLGLAIVSKLSKLLSGTITVESEVGKGSKFSFSVEQTVVGTELVGDIYENINNTPQKGYVASFTAPNAHILAVDDVSVNLLVIKGLLKDTQVNITTAENGRRALELIKQQHFDLILMDHMMPEMDGIETTSYIRDLGEECMNADTPIIMLTANAVEGVREQYLEQGFADYLSKPVSGPELERAIVKYLPRRLVSINGNG